MRYSKQRELVMQTVQQLCDHPTAEEIYDKAAQGTCIFCCVKEIACWKISKSGILHRFI